MWPHNAWIVLLAIVLTMGILAAVWCHYLEREDRPRHWTGVKLSDDPPGFYWEE